MPRLFSSVQPINRLLVLAFVLVALVPVTFLSSHLYVAAWENAWREISEKHRLLALNLTSPVRIYVEDHRQMLSILADWVGEHEGAERRHYLEQARERFSGFRRLALLDSRGRVMLWNGQAAMRAASVNYAADPIFKQTLAEKVSLLSGAQVSLFDGTPTILLSQPVMDQSSRLIGVLMAELDITPLEKLRADIHFGEKGHSAFVDARGRVIAHPNPDWMREIRDISHLSVVQAMMSGSTGVTEFYSPFVKQDMVAGYTAVPNIGWGIMVPQPKHEVESQVWRLMVGHVLWAIVGVLLAIIISVIIARWITRHINMLARDADRMIMQGYDGRLSAVPVTAPIEVQQLAHTLNVLVTGFSLSQKEIKSLNASLQQRIEEATRRLRATNEELERALERSDEFVSFARHDLRKPLSVIRDIGDVLIQDLRAQNGRAPEDLEDSLLLVTRSCDYMQDIINNFLGQHTLAEGRVDLNFQPIDLNEVARLVVEANHAYATRKEIALGTDFGSGMNTIEADESNIAQVINNFVDNAIKFGRPGDKVIVATRRDENGVRVEVRDSGPGLSELDLGKAFQRAEPLGNKPTGGEISTGLGLSICRHIVEQHGGRVGVNNNLAAGATFWFELPLTR